VTGTYRSIGGLSSTVIGTYTSAPELSSGLFLCLLPSFTIFFATRNKEKGERGKQQTNKQRTKEEAKNKKNSRGARIEKLHWCTAEKTPLVIATKTYDGGRCVQGAGTQSIQAVDLHLRGIPRSKRIIPSVCPRLDNQKKILLPFDSFFKQSSSFFNRMIGFLSLSL